jgi:hypothetical protein
MFKKYLQNDKISQGCITIDIYVNFRYDKYSL